MPLVFFPSRKVMDALKEIKAYALEKEDAKMLVVSNRDTEGAQASLARVPNCSTVLGCEI